MASAPARFASGAAYRAVHHVSPVSAHPMRASGAGWGRQRRDGRMWAMTDEAFIEDRHCHVLGRAPGLPDQVFEHDGLITKHHVRATALAHLRPLAGELLWDVGTGAGSVAVEWCRAAEGARAVGIERNPVRAARARNNATRLTAPGVMEVLEGAATELLSGLPRPDAVFIGGGGTAEVVEHVMDRLRPGGRVVVHGITIEAEMLCVEAQRRWGGQLSRMQVETAQPLGALTGWQPARTVISWVHVKPIG